MAAHGFGGVGADFAGKDRRRGAVFRMTRAVEKIAIEHRRREIVLQLSVSHA